MPIDKRDLFALYYKRISESFRRHLRKLFAVAIVASATLLVFQLQFMHKWFPELSQVLKLEDPSQVILLTLVVVLIERVLHIEDGLREERERKRLFRIHAERGEAYAEICTLIRDRGKRLKTVDLLQFSGATALPVVKEIAKTWPKAQIRLLLVPQDVADRYDESGFHWTRIRATLDELKLLTEEDSPGFDIKVWFYQTAPAISGIIIDDWFVSAGNGPGAVQRRPKLRI